jgi:hypothetical protein
LLPFDIAGDAPPLPADTEQQMRGQGGWPRSIVYSPDPVAIVLPLNFLLVDQSIHAHSGS